MLAGNIGLAGGFNSEQVSSPAPSRERSLRDTLGWEWDAVFLAAPKSLCFPPTSKVADSSADQLRRRRRRRRLH